MIVDIGVNVTKIFRVEHAPPALADWFAQRERAGPPKAGGGLGAPAGVRA